MISKFFIRRPKFAFVISIVFVIAGLIALESLPVAQFPSITPPQVVITTRFPGANAETIEKTVITPIEQEVNGVEDMIYMSSKCSNDGSATITVTFGIGTNANMNTVNTNNRVSIALPKLPAEVRQQGVTVKQKSSQILMILNVVSPTNKHDGLFLSNYASLNIKDAVSRIPGVGEAQTLGAQDYSMRIWLNPEKMASLKITTQDVIDSIQEQNIQVAAGQIGAAPSEDDQQFNYTIQTKGRLTSVDEFKNIIIRQLSDGSAVKVGDIAKVELGAATYSSYGELDGKPSANLAIYQLPGANALDVAHGVINEVNKLKQTFGKDIDCKILYNTTAFVDASVHEVMETLYIAVFLVILVVFVFLQDWRSTLVPVIAIPVSLIGTFAFMLAMGYSINTISLFGLVLAIGIVVDDAIIVVENVNRIMEEEGLDPVEATKKSMDEVTGPVIATTLVLFAVFIPVAFLPGITGELYRQFAVTISISVGISAINALTLSPALCACILKPPHDRKKFFLFVWFEKGLDWLTRKYNRIIAVLVKRLVFVTIFLGLLFGAIYMIYGSLPTGFIPNEDQGAFMADVQLPNGSSLNRTAKVMSDVEKKMLATKGVAHVISVTGWSQISGTYSSNAGLLIAVLDDWSLRKDESLHADSIISKLNKQFSKMPSAKVSAFDLPPIPGLGTGGGFEFIIQDTVSNNPKRMSEVLNNVLYKANKSKVIDTAFSNYESNVPQIYVDVDRTKVKKLGIKLSDVFNSLQTFLGSMYVNDFNKFGKSYKVYLQAETEYRGAIEDLNSLYIRNKDNEMVPLTTVITTKTVQGPAIIDHYNMFASSTINGMTAKGYSSGDAIKEMEKIAKDTLPDGMTFSWTGTAYQEILAGSQVAIIFLLALLFIYLFLVAQYESWMITIAVMLSVPLAFLGAISALAISGIDNNIFAQIGFVLLFAMATKTAILIVEFAKVKREEGKDIVTAAKEAAHTRFRAVMMTAIAAVLGFLPLVLTVGAGANSRKSLGASVLGGMIFATILGTILVPIFYVIIQKIIESKWKKSEDKKEK